LDLYELADHLLIDELKINCLKFISLNMVSYLEPSFIERFWSWGQNGGHMVWLLRDLENFIKIESEEKYITFDMKAVEDIEGHTVEENKQPELMIN
jgi:hypothetical protein